MTGKTKTTPKEEIKVETPEVKTPTPVAPEVLEEVSKPESKTETIGGMKIGKPKEIVPDSLPLILPTPKDGWKNDNQAEYARYINGYAYKNPTKWETKKEVLIARLIEIGKNPEALFKYRGHDTKLSFGNQMIEQ